MKSNGNLSYAFLVFVAMLACIYVFASGSNSLWYILIAGVTILLILMDLGKRGKDSK